MSRSQPNRCFPAQSVSVTPKEYSPVTGMQTVDIEDDFLLLKRNYFVFLSFNALDILLAIYIFKQVTECILHLLVQNRLFSVVIFLNTNIECF